MNTGTGSNFFARRQKTSVNSLEVDIIGTNDNMIVKDWYLGSQYQVEQIKTSDGKTLLNKDVQKMVEAMAVFSPPVSGENILPQRYQSVLAPTLAANWN